MGERLRFVARLLEGEKMAVLCRKFASRPLMLPIKNNLGEDQSGYAFRVEICSWKTALIRAA